MERMKSLAGSLWFQVLLIAIGSRIALTLLNWYTLKVFRIFDRGYPKLYDELIPAENVLAGWSRWDAAHYALVAFQGYEGPSGEPLQARGFFPLYPMLIRFFAGLNPGADTRGDYALWGVVAANICFFGMIVLLAYVVAMHFGKDVAVTATTLLMVSPMSFFFNAGYSESLFMLCAVAAFWFAYRKQWMVAGFAMALASATRLTGLVLIPCILLIMWKHRASIQAMLTTAILGALGTIGFVIWMWIKYDDALAYWNAQSTFWGNWDQRLGNYFDILRDSPRMMIDNPENAIITLNVLLAIMAFATLPWVWKLLEPGLALFTTIMVVFHSVYTWHSLGRYLLAGIGVYVVLAILLNKPGWNTGARTAAIVASSMVLATMSVLFAHGFWIV